MVRSFVISPKQVISASILIAALGYFVDIYDLILFSIVRIKSLKGLGLPDDQLLPQGVFLINMQMGGMLLGGILWGILGDKKGRLSVLLGSIFLYSIANIANGLVHSVGSYAFCRLIAGIGLAGELGAGITLVSEVMSKEARGYGTMMVAVIGILGAVLAALIGDLFDWRLAYFVGGIMGLGLLLLRIRASESGMFKGMKHTKVKRGALGLIFKSSGNTIRYLCCIFIGVPLWFVIGILVTFSPEFGKALGMIEIPKASTAVMCSYIGLSLGGLASGCLSQILKNRRGVTAVFMALNAAFMLFYLFYRSPSSGIFYMSCLGLGFASGYWALFVTIAAEQFGTNIRSTVATTVPNFVRGAVVPLTMSFQFLKNQFGIIEGALIVASVCVVMAFAALFGLQETYGKQLDYVELD
ncbi:MAG: MFS transporter [Candidatus Omnitrophica bacterium]|nr:MFS transporter [Candidatus Omnitrophota bacterium]